MTAGFFAPMPPAPTGVADYASNLLRALRTHGSVELSGGNVKLYHLGNNGLHREIYFRALREPGVIVLHDAVLHHFLLGTLTRDQYVEEFRYNYGDWTDCLAAELWNRRGLSASDERYFEFPMLRRVCETSRAVIVHNPAAVRAVARHCPSVEVFEIPHLFVPEPRPSEVEILDIRRALAVRPEEPLCAVFGYLRESKRIRTVIEACGAAQIRLLIAGTCPNDLAKSLAPYFCLPWVVRRPFADYRTYTLLRHAADICANLRYPSAHETSGITVSLMGGGKTVLVSNAEENSGYPGDACVRIDSGIAERDHVTSILTWLREFPSYIRDVGSRAQLHIGQEHSVERVAAMYWDAIRATA